VHGLLVAHGRPSTREELPIGVLDNTARFGQSALMTSGRGFLVAALIAVTGIVGCATDEASREDCGDGATCNTSVSCQPVLRFRLGDIEYENQRFDDQVAQGDLGPVVGEVSVHPAALDRCETVVLQDGEGSLPAGTKVYEIEGVDHSVALTASIGSAVYLKYLGRPVP
jgi:hypothetical protein